MRMRCELVGAVLLFILLRMESSVVAFPEEEDAEDRVEEEPRRPEEGNNVENPVRARANSNKCPKLRLKNGRVRIRGGGRVARFICTPGYDMVGKRFATCVRGHWTNPPPFCVARGCDVLKPPRNGQIFESYKGAMLNFDCDPGYELVGSLSIHCDGLRWNSSIPSCQPATTTPALQCDFETEDLCGWLHDPTHDFDWKRHNFATPSGHVGTGPSHDHTFGEGREGYYMYTEASSPRKENDTARLMSPVYRPELSENACFTFWYHMYGATSGFLRVFVKPESLKVEDLPVLFAISGDQGNTWYQGAVRLPTLNENFQVVVEGIRGTSYVSDTAIDDVMLANSTKCEMTHIPNSPTGDLPRNTTCSGRCDHETPDSEQCQCTGSCKVDKSCCAYYVETCASGDLSRNVTRNCTGRCDLETLDDEQCQCSGSCQVEISCCPRYVEICASNHSSFASSQYDVTTPAPELSSRTTSSIRVTTMESSSTVKLYPSIIATPFYSSDLLQSSFPVALSSKSSFDVSVPFSSPEMTKFLLSSSPSAVSTTPVLKMSSFAVTIMTPSSSFTSPSIDLLSSFVASTWLPSSSTLTILSSTLAPTKLQPVAMSSIPSPQIQPSTGTVPIISPIIPSLREKSPTIQIPSSDFTTSIAVFSDRSSAIVTSSTLLASIALSPTPTNLPTTCASTDSFSPCAVGILASASLASFTQIVSESPSSLTSSMEVISESISSFTSSLIVTTETYASLTSTMQLSDSHLLSDTITVQSIIESKMDTSSERVSATPSKVIPIETTSPVLPITRSPKSKSLLPSTTTNSSPLSGAESFKKPESSARTEKTGFPAAIAGGVVVAVVLFAAVVGAATYYAFKRRKLRREKLAEDSDVRYLKDGYHDDEEADAESSDGSLYPLVI